MLLAVMTAAAQRLTLPDLVVSPSSTVTVPVGLETDGDVVAAQFSINMPSGVTASSLSVRLTERAVDHQVVMRDKGGNSYMVMVFSPTNTALRGNSGDLVTFSATIGDLIVGQDYPMTLSDVALSDVSGANVLKEAIDGKFTIKRMPNLHVVSVDCSEAIAGDTMTVRWKVRNDGGDATGDVQWKDYIWLTPSIEVGTAMENSCLLATLDNVTALSVGENYEGVANVKLKERIYGNYDLVVMTNMSAVNNIDFSAAGGTAPVPYDPEHSTYGFLKGQGNTAGVTLKEENEFDGMSDNFFYKRIDIQVPPLPDIQVPHVVAVVDNSKNNNAPSPLTSAGLASSTAFYSGKNVKVTATITNGGGGEIKSTSVSNVLYLSSTPDLSSGKVYRMDIHSMVLALQPGETVTDEFTTTIPYDWSGDTYFVVDIDVNDNVYELANTANNRGATALINTLLTPGADFEPYNLSVPSQSSSAKAMDISYSVRNIGPGVPFVNTWTDEIYISTKSTGIDSNAKLLTTHHQKGRYTVQPLEETGAVIIGEYNPYKYEGDDYSVNLAVNTTGLQPGTYYVYVKVDADNNVVEYDGETNNVIMSGPIELSAPDLIVELESISEETLNTGDQVAVAWRLRNIGNADLQNAVVTDGFYAATGTSTEQAVSLGTATNTVSIVAGGEKVLRTNITVPRNNRLAGTRNFLIQTNVDRKVSESDMNNNTSQPLSRQFVYVEDPAEAQVNGTNLTVTQLHTASECLPGQNISLSYVVKNTGSLPISRDVKQEIFISGSNIFDNTALPLSVGGSLPSVNGLAAGSSVSVNVEVKIPETLMGGQKTLFVAINRDKTLAEKKYEDNRVSAPVYISGNLPNPAVSALSVPEIVMTSQPTEVTWTLANTGSWESGYISCELYLSNNASTWRGKPIKTVAVDSLAAGDERTMSAAVTIDDNVTGRQYLIVRSVSSGGEELTADDNVCSRQFTVRQSPLPDLVISDLSVDEVIRAGQQVTVSATVTNTGDDATHKDKWVDMFYLSENHNLDINSAIKLGGKTHVGKLEKDGSYEIKADLTVPSSVKGYYMLYAVVDGNAVNVEKSDDNNRARKSVYVQDASDTPSDLAVSKVSVPARIMAGDAVSLSYTIANNGEYAATGRLRDVLYMSRDNAWDEGDVMVGVATGNVNILPGTEMVRSVTGRITNMPEGNYYLIVRVNSAHGLAESDYDNNQIVALAPSKVTFRTLELETTAQVNTSGLFKLPLHSGLNGKTVGVYLTVPENASAGLYESFGSVPSTARYDHAATLVDVADQEVLIPDVEEGNYYILAQDNAAVSRSLNEFVVDGEGDLHETLMTLTAREVPFGATSLSVSQGGNKGWISTEVRGALLDSIMDFRLKREGVVIPAESITFRNRTASQATFNLNDVETGSYDVVSELPDGTMAVMPDGFRVIPGVNVPLGVKLEAPSGSRVDGYAPVTVAYVNSGNTDVVIRELLLTIEGGKLSTTIEGLKSDPQSELHIYPDVKQDNRGFVVIPPGKQETVNYYFVQTSNQTNLRLYIVK